MMHSRGGAMRPSSVMATFISTSGRRCWLQRAKPSSTAVPRPGRRQARPRSRRHAGDPSRDRRRRGWDRCGGHHAPQSRRNQRLGARTGAADVVARLQGDVGRAAAQPLAGVLCGNLEGNHLRVIDSRTRATLADDLTARSRITQPTAGLGELTAIPRRASSRARCIQ